MFNLTCSNNKDSSQYTGGAKNCYRADIVYGELSQFQFDKLRDNYSQLGTLAGREANTVIIDEVDAMFVDDKSKVALLSSSTAGMDHFQAIYVFIWQQLVTIMDRLVPFNGKMYFLYGDNEANVYDGNEEKYLSENGKLIEQEVGEFLKDMLSKYLDDKENIVKVPANFSDFFKLQRPKWIRNAIEAWNFQENVHYVVKEGQIKPVDFFSTGIVHSGTTWSDGLHQFLQRKSSLFNCQ